MAGTQDTQAGTQVGTHGDQERRDGAVDGGDVCAHPEAGIEADQRRQIAVVVDNAVEPVHTEQLGQADTQVRPARRVVVHQVHDVAAALAQRRSAS